MKLHAVEKLNNQQPGLRLKDLSRLRKQAEVSGIPVFALRMMAAQKVSLPESETTVRYRHD